MRFRLPVVTLLATLILLAGSMRFIRTARTPSAPPARDESVRTPLLVELFASEGCSSCPPADALLQTLDQSQPVSTAELIVLSEHVDYWNSIGWRDPYSSHEYSERQSAYAAHFGNGSIYTSQMVVDGRFEFVGSDESQVSRGENAGRRLQHVAVVRSLTRIGTVDASSEFSRDSDLKSKSHANLRLVVIVQQPDAGRVLGARLTRLSN